VPGLNGLAQNFLGSPSGHSRQTIAIGIVRAVGSHLKELPESGGCQLSLRSVFDIPREEAESHLGELPQLVKKTSNAGKYADVPAVSDFFRKPFKVTIIERRKLCLDAVRRNTVGGQQREHNLWISLPMEIISIDRARSTVYVTQRSPKRSFARTACGDESSIHVEQNQVSHEREVLEESGEMARRRSTVLGKTSKRVSMS